MDTNSVKMAEALRRIGADYCNMCGVGINENDVTWYADDDATRIVVTVTCPHCENDIATLTASFVVIEHVDDLAEAIMENEDGVMMLNG